jgi:hypothetical protein
MRAEEDQFPGGSLGRAGNPSARERFLFNNPDADPADPAEFVVVDELNFCFLICFLKRNLAT